MSKPVKKALSLLLCVALLFGVAPLEAFVGQHWPQFSFPSFSSLLSSMAHAADSPHGTCGDSLTWTYDVNAATLTISGSGAMNNYDRASYNGTYVTKAPWKLYYQAMQTVVIDSGVSSVGNYAFYGCTGLTNVTISDSVASIGGFAFYGCIGLSSVALGNGVTSIGSNSFYGCTGLTSLTIPDSVTSIGGNAFYGCIGMQSLTLGSGVTSIGNYAFRDCTALTVIKFNAISLSDLKTSSGAFFNAGIKEKGINVTFGDSVQRIPAYLFYVSSSNSEPKLKSVTIGNSVTSIGNYAFRFCTDLTSVSIPNSVTSIGQSAFHGCTGLISLTIPDNVTKIGSNAFYRLANVVYHGSASGSPWGARSLNGYVEAPLVFADSAKTKLLACVTSYSGEIIIPNSVTSIGNYAFENCSGLTSVTFGNGITSIGSFAFEDCIGLTSVSIPNSVTSIGMYAFTGCSGLTSATISNSITSIGEGTFRDCSGLTSVSIPQNVTRIDNTAFSGCTRLTSIAVDKNNTVYHSAGNCIIETASKTLIVGCQNSVIPNDGSVTSIGNSAFSGCTGLTKKTSSHFKWPPVIVMRW